MPNIGPMELIIVLVIALLVLGPKRLPDAGRSVGKGLREFKDAISGNDDDDRPLTPVAAAAPAAPVATPAPVDVVTDAPEHSPAT
jgi:sec-independent protein translocase protein TatA